MREDKENNAMKVVVWSEDTFSIECYVRGGDVLFHRTLFPIIYNDATISSSFASRRSCSPRSIRLLFAFDDMFRTRARDGWNTRAQ